MNLTSEDPAVRKAAITNLTVEAVTMVLSLALMTYTICGDRFTQKVTLKIKQLRTKIFGPPPPSEEDIERYAKLTVIEATKIVREAEA